jgi:hypothetical protein
MIITREIMSWKKKLVAKVRTIKDSVVVGRNVPITKERDKSQ